MIYLHVIKRPGVGARSPLDFNLSFHHPPPNCPQTAKPKNRAICSPKPAPTANDALVNGLLRKVSFRVGFAPCYTTRRVTRGKSYRSFNKTVVRRAKQGASCQVKDLMFQNLASRNYRVLQSC